MKVKILAKTKTPKFCANCGVKLSKLAFYLGFKRCRKCSKTKSVREKLRQANLGKHPTKETRRKMRLAKKDSQKFKEFIKNRDLSGKKNGMYGVHRFGKDNPNHKHGRTLIQLHCINCGKKLGKLAYYFNKNKCASCKRKEMFKNNPEVLKNALKALQVRPNKPEKLLLKILNNLFPNQYKYVGDGKRIVEGFCPDFIDLKNKKIIEHNGDYWHTRKDIKEKDKRKLIAYAKSGYQCLTIWEHELKYIEKVINRLIEFTLTENR